MGALVSALTIFSAGVAVGEYISRNQKNAKSQILILLRRTNFINSLSDEQIDTCNDDTLTFLSSTETDYFLQFQLQQITLNLVNDIIANL